MASGKLVPLSSGNRAVLAAGQAAPGAPLAPLTPVADPERERLIAAQAGLTVHETEALNCETPLHLLGAEVTPTAQFYRRNHFPVPVLDPATWRLAVGGLVDRALRLSLPELTRSSAETTTITLECAGNDRARFEPPTPGVPWGSGAVGTAEWTGPRLADVLALAGVRDAAREVICSGADQGPVDGQAHPVRFERSMSVRDAVCSGAVLAYAMNGEPLAARHGYPLRLVVPGWYAAASVKWLTEIRVTDKPFDGYFQSVDYMYDAGDGPARPVRLQQVRALITRPATGQEMPGGAVIVRGVAWSGAAPVDRVEVSVAGGPWQKARLAGVAHAHGWQPWELVLTGLPSGEVGIRARARDLSGAVQPDRPERNRSGYEANFIHEITLTIR
jgi:DMSO/TMAO reductase YedYZ molybdopterin-dependent catalytic subunit